MYQGSNNENGYMLVGALVLIALALIVTMGMLDSAATNSKTRTLVNTQSEYYYEVEETMNRVVAWLQKHSKYITDGFTAANFSNNFDLGTPTYGSNEGEHFGVPTMVKMKGTNNSAMLSNNDFFGQPNFPSLKHLDDGTLFDAISEFRSANLGKANARVILTWARESDGNYEPIFRIDAVTGNNPDRGVHSYTYVYSHLVASAAAVGFYGKQWLTFKTPNNDCYSYLYNHDGTSWQRGAPRSNCPIASDGQINIGSDIYGTAKTLADPGLNLLPPGGNVSGTVCEGPGCHGYNLPTFGNWDSYCQTHNGDLSLNADLELSEGGCYRDVSIENKKVLTLSDTENPYYIRSLDFTANFAKFSFGDVPLGKQVTLFVEQISNNAINGDQWYNGNNAPHQGVVNYIGTTNLKLNGTAGLNMIVVAPKVNVEVNGNFSFNGAIMADSLLVSGNSRVNYDENIAGATPVLSDMTFSLKKASQRYR